MLHSKTTKRAPLPPIRYSQIPYVIDYKTQCGGDCGVQMTPRGNNSGHSDTNSEPASASHTVHNVAHQIGALKKSLLHEHSRRLLAEQRASRAEELARNVLDRLSSHLLSLTSAPSPPMDLQRLPPELLPSILEPLSANPRDLLPLLTINKEISHEAYKLLYHFVALRPWERPDKLVEFFSAVASNKQLAHLVKKLEIRSFPRQISSSERTHLYDTLTSCLQHFVNLEICSWTRAMTLTTEILSVVSMLPKVAELEINSGNDVRYDEIFTRGRWPALHTLKIILPDRSIARALRPFLQQRGEQLVSLTILAKESGVIDDNYLNSVAGSLVNLHQLSLGGLKRVTDASILSILKRNPQISSLALESLNLTNSHWELSMPRLSHLSVTYTSSGVLDKLLDAIKGSTTFRSFTIYSSGLERLPYLPVDFVERLVNMHWRTLTTLRIHHVMIAQDMLKYISHKCPNLTEMVVHLPTIDISTLVQDCAPRWTHLEKLHLLGEPSTGKEIQMEHLLPFVDACHNLTQVGWRSRVWKVHRHGQDLAHGSRDARLSGHEMEEEDEAFGAWKDEL
ncbi:hypothetical protein E3P99_02674 [Wallemia hederae]|uniref:F-box domain-containing protein n=1 Tax=Wallemia hederae TaxID=1540922 RepID=A0A4T0FNB9_9BASI|nr:hypothetical protein E3P99_02674 [Wallemia hederae]